jgi:hypothetical protein
MPAPWSRPLRGRLDEHTITSSVLVGNPLDDPNQRPLWVYVPPGAGDESLPSIYVIQGYTGQLDIVAQPLCVASDGAGADR